MPRAPKAAAAVDTSELVAHLSAEYLALGDTHPERSAQIEQQLASLDAPLPTQGEE